MSLKRVGVLMLMIFMLASCAGWRAKPETPAQDKSEALAEEPFSLPDIEGTPIDRPEATDKTDHAGQGKPDLEAVAIESVDTEDFIILNFDNTDIRTILATFGELLNINYILTPGVTGSVTIQSYSRFPTKNLFSIFQSILEVNGLTAIKDGDFYRIMPIDSAKSQPMEVISGLDSQYTLDSAFVTQVVPMKNVKASEVSNILRQLMPRGTNLIVYEPSNLLIITSLPNTLEKFIKIIETLDVDSMDSGAIRTFVYYIENGEAKKLEEILKTVYVSKAPGASTSTSALSSTAPRTPATPRATDSNSLPGDLGEVTITAYEDINALIIKCSPRSYISLLQVLKSIDVPPKQVMIEVMIAEVTLSDETSYGLEWASKLSNGNFFGMNPSRFIDGGALKTPGNITFDSGELGQFAAVSSGAMGTGSYVSLFTALSQNNDLNVMASPNILAMDNKEAEIKIGSEVPTATSTTQSNEGITTSSQIQYKTVGTILTVTPHITEKGNVSMKIVVESSDIGIPTQIGSGDYPSFVTRKATTNALVTDGHTLFLGGLISNKKSQSSSGIPLLSKIPIIGYLFGGHTWKDEKTEMFVMVTPHVVNNSDEADVLTTRFNDRVKYIKKAILKISDKKEKTPEKAETKTQPEPEQPEKTKSLPDEGAPQPYIPGTQ